MAMCRYEYRHRVSVSDKERNGQNPRRRRKYKLEVRTNFILKSIDESEILLGTEKFSDRLRLADDENFKTKWGPRAAFFAFGKQNLDNSLRSRLSSYGMPDAQIRSLIQTTFDLVRHPRHSSLRTIRILAAVDVCTVQSEGERLAAAVNRAVVPDVLTPLRLRLTNVVRKSKPSDDELLNYLRRLPVVRVREDEDIDDVESCPICIEVMSNASEVFDKNVYHEKHSVGFKEGLGLMEECSICLRETIVGAKIATLPCKHSFHDHCIFSRLLKRQSCPVCRVKIEYKPDSKKLLKMIDSLHIN